MHNSRTSTVTSLESPMAVGRLGRIEMKYVMSIGWLMIATSAAVAAPAANTSPPDRLGAHVLVFNGRMPVQQIQTRVDEIARQQISNQFGPERYALLFEPGSYGSAARPLTIQVGYYTQVSGLGASPGEVVIHGTVQVRNQCFKGQCGALDNFWRSISNLTVDVPASAAGCESGEIWAVSQAAPMRRVRVLGGELKLTDTCSRPSYASGGFIADSQFDRPVQNGGQQQFLVRNSDIQGWSNGSWNQVFAGVRGAPAPCFPARPNCGPYTTIAASPAVREAPFVFADSRHHYQVFVPGLERNVAGTSWSGRAASGHTLALDAFYIASPADSAATLNTALASGKNLILSPGVYHLRESIAVQRADTIILGLGFPTLVPEGGVIPMTVSAAHGVSISGLLFDAGETNSPELLRVGVPSAHENAPSDDPTSLHDVFFRIGGAAPGRATVSLVINSDNVILDDIWAWRADHGQFVGWTTNTADTGLIVNGNNVTAYGLFVEHYQKTEVIWNGDNGTDVFLQNEMPYDPPAQAAWRESPDVDGFSAFKLGDAVTHFHGYGMGSYCYFSQGVAIYASDAFEVPPTLPPASLQNLFTIFLAAGSGGIRNVINGQGGSYTAGNPHGPVTVSSYP
jgi:hypothetical protein